MSKRRGMTRREFLRDAAIAAGSFPLVGLAPALGHAGQASEPKLGAQLIGKLEGPELVLNPAKWPEMFGEAPMLAEMVKAGKLPPVQERIPAEPMVIKPVHSIGKYGGTWRRGFTGPGDGENGNRIVSTDKILFWDFTGTKIMPCVARDWKMSDDGRIVAILLRTGHRWSDGHPFTADDFVFWYEDVYLNKDLNPTPHPDFMVNGEPGRLFKRDDYTVVFEFPEPNFLFVDILAGSTSMGGGQAREQHQGRNMGAYMPAHYLKQFHPKYVAKEELDKRVRAAGFDGWVSLIKSRWDWRLNAELPVLAPWKTVSPINTPTWLLERNPFYYAVDTQGNQLPYLDRISMALAENLEVLNLRAIAGQYDLQERHTSLGKLPVFLENRSKGAYDVRLDPAAHGSDATLQTNQSYDADPEIAKWIQTSDFRRALSLGIDRDQLNETFWLGLGIPGSPAPAETMPESPGPEWRKKWSSFNPKQANAMLDNIGLDKKDAEGYRLRTDGKGRLRLEVLTPGGSIVPYTQLAEMIKEQWRKIGIQADVKEVERNLFFTRIASNEHQIAFWVSDGSEQIYLFPRYALPVDPAQSLLGHPIARWYASGGAQGKPPKDPRLLQALELFRSAPGKKTEERRRIAQEIWKILVDEQYSIGTVGQSPATLGVRIVSRRLGNIPARQVNAQHARTPGSSHPATFYFKS
ncbi:MAG TPA: ABC transporter substrate-binding protein [Candidatus Methylomirabilis sp.]|nr:ABC transporter substrate-binding protein [Candidatus Methylomirabilis sp.]